MIAATPSHEIDAKRETPTPTMVLLRTQKELTDRPSPVEPTDQAMTATDVRAALAQLTPENRHVIVEMFYVGRSVTQIAQLLSIPEGTVTSRSYYGLRQLKRLIAAKTAL